MLMTMKMTAAYLDSQGIKYRVDEEHNRLNIGFNMKNMQSMQVVVIFDEEQKSCALRSFDYVKFPAEKSADMYKLCNDKNFNYRWVKFYVDDRDNTVTLADDAVIQLDSCGAEVWELVQRMLNIGDNSYRDFMKAIWA